MLGKLLATIFLVAIALVPIAIVAVWHSLGAIWVTGYVIGLITTPLVGIGAIRAMDVLFEDTKALIAVVIYGIGIIALSLAAAVYIFVN